MDALSSIDQVMDYDQLLAKPPKKPEAIFHWHQVGWEDEVSLIKAGLSGLQNF